MKRITFKVILALFFSAAIAVSIAETSFQLVMVEEEGCIYCARWDADISPEYPITPEGIAAPLRRIDVNEPIPDDLSFKSKPRVTPTFVLMKDGVEQARLEGYPGEDFFWGLLNNMLVDSGVQLE